ncbi:MAG TPA: type IX secretion system sortase PorU [Edaphocola sp.]|nr:type IX secretion system sortase PorU [Edaphocola sp.]
MNKKYILGILMAFSIVQAANAQTTSILNGAENIVPQNGQSYYSQRIPLENNTIPDIKLTDIQSADIEALPFKNVTVSNSFIPDVFIATERKQKYAIIQTPVFRKKDGHLAQLKAYKIKVTYPETPATAHKEAAKPTTVSHSVLAQGTWYKIAVSHRGIYRIDYAFLQSLGINPAQVNPGNIRLFGNGGTILPEAVSDDQPDDLIENAIEVHASGNTFQQGDYVLFYANGPVLWAKDSFDSRFKHTNNYYEDKSYYFLTVDQGPGLRVQNETATGSASQTFTDFNDYAVYDRDSVNIGAIGRTWWSNTMNSQTGMPSSTNINMDLGAVEDSVYTRMHVANVNDASGNILSMKINGQTVQTSNLNTNINSNVVYYYTDQTPVFTFVPGTAHLNITFNYTPAGNGSAYIDFIEMNYKRPLNFSGKELAFRNWKSAALPAASKAGYTISNASPDLKVWDITNPLKPIALNGTLSGSNYKFTRNGGELHEFIAFSGNQFDNPKFIGPVANQDLHGLAPTDLLIITNNALKPAAEAFAAFHGQPVTVATVDKIYNEFSSGGQDIGGIRNFIKMFYDKASGQQDMIKNVLLLGAASYDYKDRIANNTNIVPTYETVISSNESSSFSTDDYFAILDPGETVLSDNNLLDVGIGRIPATTNDEAMTALAKLEHYISPASFGPWKNNISFVADDHDDASLGFMNHLADCETISRYFYRDNRQYNLYKIYADAYNKVAEAGGSRYPEVNKAIDNRIFNGTFLMSYSGHGSATRWSHEAILTPDDYDNWDNYDKLPIMFTGTCDFGRFDDPAVKYAGVKLMMNPDGGCIAIITTTQAVYRSGNTDLASHYMQEQFSELIGGEHQTLGEALRESKNAISNGTDFNKIKYVLLGDPALRLPLPELNVQTDSLLARQNGQLLANDTLKALGSYALKGSVTSDQGAVQSDFNGSVYVTIFDKPTTVQTVNTAPGVTPTFNIQNNIVARVRATVTNGRFTADFIVPKDINYDMGKGKISYYANSDTKDANGLDTTVNVGGVDQQAGSDNAPPVVKAYIDNDKFHNGGVTGPNPMLYVQLSDDNGINVSGSSIGHDLVAILDGDIQNPINLNDYYQTNEGDFRKGYVYYPMYNLPDGAHTVTVKAWDSYNNSGEGSVSFVVKNKDKGFISELYNYPNPVTDITHFVFQHNQAGVQMTVTLQIFNAAGALQWAYQKEMTPEGNRTEIIWDGKGINGQPLARGVYFYRLHIQTKKGVQATAYQKLVMLRP